VKSPGRFITLEGIEGVGKSTSLAWVKTYLEQHGIQVLATREPGGTALAEHIRALVLDHGAEPLPPTAELLLIFAARSAHLENLIRPQLQAGNWVVCDRFTDATFAYQGGGRGLSTALIEDLAGAIHGDLWPDLTLLLDAPVAVGQARRRQRGPADRIEAERSEFFERVRATYLKRQRAVPERIKLIDASGSLEEVQNALQAQLADLLNRIKKNL
jgi:dTMP kinase